LARLKLDRDARVVEDIEGMRVENPLL